MSDNPPAAAVARASSQEDDGGAGYDEEDTVVITARGGVTLVAKPKILEKFAFFESLLSGRWGRSGSSLNVDMDAKLLNACLAYAETDFKRPSVLLTKLSSTVDATELVELANFLACDLPVVTGLEDLVTLEKGLKDVSSEQMIKVARRTYDRSYDIPDRMGARDSAAALCFTMLQPPSLKALLKSSPKVKSKLNNDVMFVVSHAKTFGPRLRSHVWKAYQERFALTPKQMKQFDSWVSGEKLKFDLYRDSDDEDDSASRTDCDCSTGSIHEDEFDYGDY